MNIDLIPCEICHQQFPPDQYIIHITTHTPNDTNTTNNSSHHPNYSNTNHSTPIINTIPCDKCSQQIPLNQYDSHLLMHSLSNTNSNSNNNNNNNNTLTTATIPCSHCNKQIPITNYETHQLSHIHDPYSNNSTNTNTQLIPCEYSNCTIKWIPSNEYNDHITLHKLQSEQSQPNTSNDEMIALHTQTQLIKQQTASLHSGNRQLPDPRRICLSNAFIHLSNTQRPVIPMHDTLITNINNNYININTFSNNNNNNQLPSRDNHNVNCIIDSLEHILSRRKHIEYYLCNKLSFYYRNREDYSWGCGFRNCQTLTSVLCNNKLYNKYVYNSIGYVPIINQIQKYLDYAHAQGFDPEGLKELGQTTGTRQWIGAVDVAALLRSWNIPACIFDFQLSSTNNQLYHDDLFDWVWEYFVQRYKYYGINDNNNNNNNNNNNGNGQQLISSYFNTNINNNNNNKFIDDMNMKKVLEMSRREHEMKNKNKKDNKMEMSDSDSNSSFSDNNQCDNEEEKKIDENDNDLYYWDGYDSDNNNNRNKDKYKGNIKDKYMKDNNNNININTNNNKGNRNKFIAPLYFQHQGHSRTIIGIIYNKKSKIRHLLVLDPSVKKGGINLLNNIKNGNMQQLLRSKKQIKAAKYQIVAIPTFGIMTNNDRNRCKTIQSMDVTLIKKNTKK